MNDVDDTALPGVPAGQQGPNQAASLIDLWQQNAVLVTIAALVLGALASAVVITWVRRRDREPATDTGARLYYLVCLMCTAISANTSWRFFGGVLQITNVVERAGMFAVLETALVACGFAMRSNVRKTVSSETAAAQPGAPRMVAWLLAGLAGYMAVAESGLGEGIARVALGPVLGIVSLHLALGIELRQRQRHGESRSTAARVLAELRERFLSVLGIADERRDALDRIRDRHARRAARLALAPASKRRDTRLQKALRKSGVAHDQTARDRLLAELAVLRHATALASLEQPSPWLAVAGSGETTMPEPEPENTGAVATHAADTATNGHAATAADIRPTTNGHAVILPTRPPQDPRRDMAADIETTDIIPAVTVNGHVAVDRTPDMATDTAVSASVPADEAAMSAARSRPGPAAGDGHDQDGDRSEQPGGPVHDADADDDEGLDDLPIQGSDERVQELVRELHAGKEFTGTDVGELFSCSARTGRRLLRQAERIYRRHLDVASEQ